MSNRIKEQFKKKSNLLSIYFTAGYPKIDDTVDIICRLEDCGVDMIEIGLPFSDPLADGPVIQNSSEVSLANGMNSELLFKQLQGIRNRVDIPLLIMGYFNPILQFGLEKFCSNCASTGIDGLIIPDLPFEIYKDKYEQIFDIHGIHNTFLITPQTSEKRIFEIDKWTTSFIYMVSTASTTGIQQNFATDTNAYFERINKLNLDSPALIGFGISNRATFKTACNFSQGAIIGSAFIKHLENKGINEIGSFVKNFS